MIHAYTMVTYPDLLGDKVLVYPGDPDEFIEDGPIGPQTSRPMLQCAENAADNGAAGDDEIHLYRGKTLALTNAVANILKRRKP